MFSCLPLLHGSISSLSPFPPSSLHRRCDPHCMLWIIELKPGTLLLLNKSQAFSLSLFPLLLPFLLMVLFPFDLWHHIRSQGNVRFCFFPTLLWLILKNYGTCLSGFGRWARAWGQINCTHTFTDYNMCWTAAQLDECYWFWQHFSANGTLGQLKQWKDCKCVWYKWGGGGNGLFNGPVYVLWSNSANSIYWGERDLAGNGEMSDGVDKNNKQWKRGEEIKEVWTEKLLLKKAGALCPISLSVK